LNCCTQVCIGQYVQRAAATWTNSPHANWSVAEEVITIYSLHLFAAAADTVCMHLSAQLEHSLGQCPVKCPVCGSFAVYTVTAGTAEMQMLLGEVPPDPLFGGVLSR